VRLFIGQAILHGFVAVVLVEALLRAWRVGRPGSRVTLRLVALAFPVLALPLLLLLAPWRFDDAFADGWALFASARWADVRLAGTGVDSVVLACCVMLGSALYLLDVLPFLGDLLAARRRHRDLPAAAPEVASALAHLSGRLEVQAPRLRVIDDHDAVVLCEGVVRPTLVVSSAAARLLGQAELHAALAHELAHASARDCALGWMLLAVRTLMWFNPFVQLGARAVVADTERRADARALAATRDPKALARAILTLARASHLAPAGPVSSRRHVLRRARLHAVEARCRRLLAEGSASDRGAGALGVGLAAAGLAIVLFAIV
jgi:Zn-dependent protease with chaperone function